MSETHTQQGRMLIIMNMIGQLDTVLYLPEEKAMGAQITLTLPEDVLQRANCLAG